jgi:Beta/Gamma crystallin/Peptidase inhibitor family I36
MKRLPVPALALLFGLCLAPQLSAAPQFGRDRGRNGDRVCVFRDIQYQGSEMCYSPGDSIATLQNFNGQASSIRIYGRAAVTVWDETNFRGHTTAFTSSIPDLGQVRLESKSWNDRIQSLQVGTEGGFLGGPPRNAPIYGRPEPPPPSRQEINEGICVYEQPNFQGRSQCWTGNEDLSDLGRARWSDRISSIRLFGRTAAVIYRDIGFRGASMVVDRDIPDLSQIGGNGFRSWANQVSSIRIEGRGFPGRRR